MFENIKPKLKTELQIKDRIEYLKKHPMLKSPETAGAVNGMIQALEWVIGEDVK
jgi:hypothetical protein